MAKLCLPLPLDTCHSTLCAHKPTPDRDNLRSRLIHRFGATLGLAQLVGHRPFLQLVMGDDYTGQYKRVIEESVELVGYFLLFVGSLESLTFVKTVQLGKSTTSREIDHG